MRVCVSSSNTSETLPISTSKNITCVGVSPDGNLALVVDEGEQLLRLASGWMLYRDLKVQSTHSSVVCLLSQMAPPCW